MILRDGLLQGVTAVVAGAPEVEARLTALGASATESPGSGTIHSPEWPVPDPGHSVLVFAPEGACDAREALDGAWEAISSHPMTETGGLIVLLAPPPGDAHAEAVRGGLENLARTLSIEWARFGVRPVAVLRGPASTDADVAELVAFLASPAGAYYSGCAFTLA